MVVPTFHVFLYLTTVSISWAGDWRRLELCSNHVPYVLSHHRDLASACESDEQCPYKIIDQCWGYEDGCKGNASFSRNDEPTSCVSDHHQRDFWFRVMSYLCVLATGVIIKHCSVCKADFGFIGNIRKEVEAIRICTADEENDSSLICARNARFCQARNLYIDFRKHAPDKDRFKEDMFEKGMIGGRCEFDESLLKEQGSHPYPLQSWYSELQNYTMLDFQISNDSVRCDVFLDKPSILMKLDSGVNIYHHFCDFFNLYLTQHVNNSWFGKDVQLIMWDTSSLGYFDIVKDAWNAFTSHPVLNLQDFTGKRVCFKEAMFSLLPRMRGGLFYNSYIPKGCVGSSMFRAFSEHFLHRMGVRRDQSALLPGAKIRVTLLQRGSPDNDHVFRQIKNQDELVKVAKEFEEFQVKVVEYNWRTVPFVEQLNITHNSDIFIGMHGAGLLHFLFLPDWAVAFELYNCGDAGCYYDLARLRGLNYITWDDGKIEAFDRGKHHRYGDNPKFWNWSFEPSEFRRLLVKARDALVAKKWEYIAKNRHDEL